MFVFCCNLYDWVVSMWVFSQGVKGQFEMMFQEWCENLLCWDWGYCIRILQVEWLGDQGFDFLGRFEDL